MELADLLPVLRSLMAWLRRTQLPPALSGTLVPENACLFAVPAPKTTLDNVLAAVGEWACLLHFKRVQVTAVYRFRVHLKVQRGSGNRLFRYFL